jgi:hypothetical protein
MSVAILAHKLNRYIGNCNDQIAQKNNFANNNNNNNMLDAKGSMMIHVKIGCTRNPNHYEQGGGSGYWNLSTYKNKDIIFNRLIPTQ